MSSLMDELDDYILTRGIRGGGGTTHIHSSRSSSSAAFSGFRPTSRFISSSGSSPSPARTSSPPMFTPGATKPSTTTTSTSHSSPSLARSTPSTRAARGDFGSSGNTLHYSSSSTTRSPSLAATLPRPTTGVAAAAIAAFDEADDVGKVRRSLPFEEEHPTRTEERFSPSPRFVEKGSFGATASPFPAPPPSHGQQTTDQEFSTPDEKSSRPPEEPTQDRHYEESDLRQKPYAGQEFATPSKDPNAEEISIEQRKKHIDPSNSMLGNNDGNSHQHHQLYPYYEMTSTSTGNPGLATPPPRKTRPFRPSGGEPSSLQPEDEQQKKSAPLHTDSSQGPSVEPRRTTTATGTSNQKEIVDSTFFDLLLQAQETPNPQNHIQARTFALQHKSTTRTTTYTRPEEMIQCTVARMMQTGTAFATSTTGMTMPSAATSGTTPDRPTRMTPSALSASGGTAAPSSAESTREDEGEEPPPLNTSWKFNSSETVSSLMNVGEAALTRLIAQKNHMDKEKAMYHSLAAVTGELVEKIRDELTALPPEQPLLFEEQEDDDSGEKDPFSLPSTTTTMGPTPAGVSGDMWEVSKKLLATPGGDILQSQISELLSLLGSTSSANRGIATQILNAYIELVLGDESKKEHDEAEQQERKTATAPRASLLEMQVEVEALKAKEAEAKQNGNLILGARVRQDLISKLNSDLNLALVEKMNILEPEIVANRDETRLFGKVEEEMRVAGKGKARLDEKLLRLERAVSLEEDKVEGVQTAIDDDFSSVQNFLAENDASVKDLVAQMSSIHTKLEIKLHERNTQVQQYIERHGANVVRHFVCNQQLERYRQQQQKLRVERINAEALVTAVNLLRDMEPGVCQLGRLQREGARKEAEAHTEEVSQLCRYLFGELRTSTNSWIDVLGRNEAREEEKTADIQRKVDEAIDRYHQQDRDSYTAQLNGILRRKGELRRDIEKYQLLIADASQKLLQAGVEEEEDEDQEDEATYRPNVISTTPAPIHEERILWDNVLPPPTILENNLPPQQLDETEEKEEEVIHHQPEVDRLVLSQEDEENELVSDSDMDDALSTPQMDYRHLQRRDTMKPSFHTSTTRTSFDSGVKDSAKTPQQHFDPSALPVRIGGLGIEEPEVLHFNNSASTVQMPMQPAVFVSPNQQDILPPLSAPSSSVLSPGGANSTTRRNPGADLVAALDFASNHPLQDVGDTATTHHPTGIASRPTTATATALFATTNDSSFMMDRPISTRSVPRTGRLGGGGGDHSTTMEFGSPSRALIPLPPETLLEATTEGGSIAGGTAAGDPNAAAGGSDSLVIPDSGFMTADAALRAVSSFALLDVDQLTVEQFLPLFQKSDTVTQKWASLLYSLDVETVQDLRDIRDASGGNSWTTFLANSPLLKAQIELLLDDPERFFPDEE